MNSKYLEQEIKAIGRYFDGLGRSPFFETGCVRSHFQHVEKVDADRYRQKKSLTSQSSTTELHLFFCSRRGEYIWPESLPRV